MSNVNCEILERGKAYLVSYKNKGAIRPTYRVVLVCSLRDLLTKGKVLATPIRKLAEWEAEREVCKGMGILFLTPRPNPQGYMVESFKHIKTEIKDYRKYMDAKVSKIVRLKLDMVESAV
jgi:hypothetical protein